MITAAIVPNTSSTFSARPKTKPSKMACSDRAPTVINGLSKILTGNFHEKLDFRENRKVSGNPENYGKKRKVLPKNDGKELLLIQ